jgi:hypothetical protein
MATLNARGNATARVVAIIACVVGALVALGLAMNTFMNLAFAGFPDSHLTDYDKAVHTPLTITAWVEAVVGVVLLALAVTPIGTRTRTIGLVLTVFALVLVAITAQVGVPWYFGTHLGLDNGIGG